MDWDYFDKFENIIDKYMLMSGEGETMASQICTAVNKLIYKWYNDGDVYDNSYDMAGWWNDLSSYANWLYNYCADDEARNILDRIKKVYTDEQYEQLLADLADKLLDIDYLKWMGVRNKQGSIYECSGNFKYVEDCNDNDDDWYDDEEEEDDE